MQNASICTSNEQTLTRTFSLVTIDNFDDVESIVYYKHLTSLWQIVQLSFISKQNFRFVNSAAKMPL